MAFEEVGAANLGPVVYEVVPNRVGDTDGPSEGLAHGLEEGRRIVFVVLSLLMQCETSSAGFTLFRLASGVRSKPELAMEELIVTCDEIRAQVLDVLQRDRPAVCSLG